MARLVGYGVSQVPTNGMLGGMAYQDPTNVSVNILRVGTPGGNFQPGNGNNASLALSGTFTGSYTPSGSLASLYAKSTLLGIANDAGVTENNSAIIGFSCLNNSGFNSQAYFGAVSSPESDGDYGRGAVLVWGRRSGGNYAESMRISRTGNVGIGSTIPAATLDVNGTLKIGAISGTNTNADLPVLFQTAAGIIDGGSGLTYNPGGDQLKVNGLSIVSTQIYGNGSALTLTTQNGNGTAQIEITDTTLQFKTGATERFRCDSSGRLMVGTTSQNNGDSKLLVSGANPNLRIESNSFPNGFCDLDFTAPANNGVTTPVRTKIRFAHDTGDAGWSGSLRFFVGGFGDTERMRIDSSGRLLVGTTSGSSTLTVNGTANISGATVLGSTLNLTSGGISNGYTGTQGAGNYEARGAAPQITLKSISGGTGNPYLYFIANGNTGKNIIGSTWDTVAPNLIFEWAGNEMARIEQNGSIYARGATDTTISSSGTKFVLGGSIGGGSGGVVAQTNNPCVYVNRLSTDGDLVVFYQDATQEGSISVSGTTVSYNGAHLSRWSQIEGIDPHDKTDRPEILRGTVMSNLDEMCDWIDPESGEAQDNEQLNKTKISDVEGDKNVAGIFQSWDDDDDTWVNDYYLAMTGDFIIRIAQGVTVERGDLLMSAGDGTAKPQDDDIIRSKTIAKVTSTNVSCTYPDGSYCVPCVLMAC